MDVGVRALIVAMGMAVVHAAAAERMNVVLILADDLGWSDTTLYGTTSLYKTPNLERLAKRGMTFTRAYSASPLCSPTRASILTGQTTARTGITSPCCHLPGILMKAKVAARAPAGEKAIQTESVSRLDTAYPTLGRQVKAAGYSTAHFGKWHLGAEPHSPLQHGFDIDIPHWPGPGPAGSFVAPWSFPDFKETEPGQHIEDRMASEAVTWMRAARERGPFYMHYWQFSVHAPFDAKKAYIDAWRPKIDTNAPQRSPTYAAMVQSLDDAVGTLLDETDRLGIADRTIFLFFSDNGGNMYNGIPETDAAGGGHVTAPTSNRPLRGGKATMYEGGIRVPCVIAWPGVTRPGSRCDAVVQSTDLYPTILGMLGLPLPAGHKVDGVDLAPALRGDPAWSRGPIFTFFPHAPGVPDWLPPAAAVHLGDWKLIRLFHQGAQGAHDYRLYHLKDDIGETCDLAGKHPGKVAELDALVEAHLRDAGAVVPVPNPAFDPAKYRPEDIGIQKGGLKVARPSRAAEAAPAKPAGPARGARKAGGWEARDESVGLVAANGELTVHSTGGDAWIKTSDVPGAGGAFTLDLEVFASRAGTMKFYGARDGKGFVRGGFVAREIATPGEWVAVSAPLSDPGRLDALRINMPGTTGITRLRNLRLRDASGAVVRSWDF
jgi:arylsulfatase A-like enzyme